MSTSFTPTDRAILKRTHDLMQRLSEKVDELIEKLDAENEQLGQLQATISECLTQVEEFAGQLRSLKTSPAAGGVSGTARGPGSSAGLSFEDFVTSAKQSQPMKSALVKVALQVSYCLSADKTQLVRTLHEEYKNKSGADQTAVTAVGAAHAATC